MHSNPIKFASLLLLSLGLSQFHGAAQIMPSDAGTVVAGFQDNFTNSLRDPNWMPVGQGGDHYTQTNGVLSVSSMPVGNPNHLLYAPVSGYDGSTQEVLIRIRILDMPYEPQGSSHAGEVVGADSAAENLPAGAGVNWQLMDTSDDGSLFGDHVDGRQARGLYDYVAWGPGYTNNDIPWQTYTWYWMRLHQDGLSTQTKTYSNIWAKVWLGDGTEAEPSSWQYLWAQDIQVADGLAGITAGTAGAICDFEVDYFLLKAAGLPNITVNPLFDSLYLNQQPVSLVSSLGETPSFSVTAVSTGSAPTYQWQKAASSSNSFSDIAGATSSAYTLPALSAADNGSAYRVVVSTASPAAQIVSTNGVVVFGATPTLLYAKTLGKPNQVTLLFSEPVSVPSGVSDFSIDNGALISGVAQGGNSNTLVLTTTGMTLGGSYTVTINGVQSSAGAVIAANTQAPVGFIVELPAEFGQVVNGFQDDFDSALINPAWTSSPTNDNPFTQSDGLLHMNTITDITTNDPVHLFYEPATSYSSDNQEILMRMRITQAPPSDAFIRGRAGASVAGDPLRNGEAANLILIDPSDTSFSGIAGPSAPQAQVLADGISWNGPVVDYGTTNPFTWQTNTWYWLRLLMTTASPPPGSNNIYAKVWQGDGSVPEPANWELTASIQLNTVGDALFAGMDSPSAGYPESFDVDYFLLETPDLPPITVTMDAFQLASSIYLSISNQPASQFVFPGQNATFTASASGSAPVTIQWQVAPSNSSTFTSIPGATGPSLTVTNVLGAQDGNQYQAIFTLAGGTITKTSIVAVLTTDVIPPALVFARTGGSNGQIIVQFSKVIPTPDVSQFSLNNGVSITGLTEGSTSNEVILTVSPLSLSSNYVLTVSDISDLYGNILVSGQANIDFNVYLPAEFGATVAGFQDDFTGATLNPAWVIYSASSGGPLNLPPPDDLASSLVSQSDGNLFFNPPPSGTAYNPVHLVYWPGTPYNSTNQEILARIMVTSVLANGSSLAGVCVCAQTNNARGINWLMCDNDAANEGPAFIGPNVTLLDDYTAWGPSDDYVWQQNTWYWMRLRQHPDLTSGGPDVFAKIWLADGATPEPAGWSETWDYTPSNLERGSGVNQGYSGFTASDSGGFTTFQVDYALIKADGLPDVLVTAPNLFPFVRPSAPSLVLIGRTLQWSGSATLQTAPSVTGPWTDVNATSPYTITTTGSAAFFRLKQ